MSRPADWERIQQLFAETLERPAEERRDFLERACGGDVALRDEVLSLLDASERAGVVERMVGKWVNPLLRELEAGLEPGTEVGDYTIVGELGRGGMGMVYHAHDGRLGRDIAIKLVAGGAGSTERLLAEARAASALDHPNICTIYHAGEDEAGRVFVAMPLYRGETLQRRLARGALPLPECIAIAVQVANGLGSAHVFGIVHRDIKPANLMVTPDGTVRILDFGIAAARGATADVVTAGTASYMAPEQLRGEEVDGRADLWALGIVLYEMCTGRRPFGGEDEASIRDEILACNPESPSTFRPELPPRLESVVSRLLAKDPLDRFASADELVEELETIRSELSGIGVRGTLPAPLTEITGRDAELEQIGTLLARSRLLTLTGPGGAGKTRLAIEVGRRHGSRYADGCRFVDLATITDPARVAAGIAHTLGLLDQPGATPLQHLASVLRERSLLLVLDNFEHVAAAAGVVRELLGACPGLRVLATSRTPLRIAGEQEVPLAPLRVPDRLVPGDPAVLLDFSAIRLFVERAQAARPDFRLTTDNAAAVAELCGRLDGLPLAIELAAARTRLFSTEELLRRLRQRIDVLQEDRGDRPRRHRRLSQAIAWSHDLLDAGGQQVFGHLSVFRGGFTLEAAAAVCGDEVSGVDSVVESLLDHSLVYRRDTEDGPRFDMLDTIRAFAQERLAGSGDADTVQRRHAEYMVRLAEVYGPDIAGSRQVAALERLDAENGNLNAALNWSEQHDPVLALRLGAGLWRFWIARGYLLEGRDHLERLIGRAVPAVSDSLRSRVLIGAGTIAHGQSDNRRATAWLEEALALCRHTEDEHGVVATLNNLSWVACETTQLERATELAEEALRLCHGLGDRRGEALALNNLGWVAQYQGNGRAARENHAASLEIRREIGDHRGAAFALSNLAWAECLCGDPVRAVALLDEAEELLRSIRDPILLGWSMVIRGIAERDRGADGRAVACFEQALDRWRHGHNRSGRAMVFTELAEIRLRTGLIEEGVRLLRVAMDDWMAIPCPWGEARARQLLLRAQLPPLES
jgi:predicted ATPase